MKRFTLLLAVILVTLIGWPRRAPILAQDSAASIPTATVVIAFARDFDPATHGILRVSKDGSQTEFFAPLPIEDLPRGLAFTDGRFPFYITNLHDFAANTSAIFDPATGTWTSTSDLNQVRNFHMATLLPEVVVAFLREFDPATGFRFTGEVQNACQVLLVDLIPVGANPHGVAITPDGDLAYVTNQGDHTVSVIDTMTDTVIATLEVQEKPTHLAITPDGRQAYVMNVGTNAVTVSVIDTETNTVIDTIGPVGFLSVQGTGSDLDDAGQLEDSFGTSHVDVHFFMSMRKERLAMRGQLDNPTRVVWLPLVAVALTATDIPGSNDSEQGLLRAVSPLIDMGIITELRASSLQHTIADHSSCARANTRIAQGSQGAASRQKRLQEVDYAGVCGRARPRHTRPQGS